jgi:hypothetical protein
MKERVYTVSHLKRTTYVLGLVVFLMAVGGQTQAKAPDAVLGKTTIAVVNLGNQRFGSATELKARVLQLVLRNAKSNSNSIKVVTKACGCAPDPQDQSGFGSCLKGCMQDVGVSPAQMVMCGASCAAAETGIGAIVCAVCVGVDVTVVVWCALGCSTYGDGHIGGLMDARIRHPHPRSGSLQAKLRLQPANR